MKAEAAASVTGEPSDMKQARARSEVHNVIIKILTCAAMFFSASQVFADSELNRYHDATLGESISFLARLVADSLGALVMVGSFLLGVTVSIVNWWKTGGRLEGAVAFLTSSIFAILLLAAFASARDIPISGNIGLGAAIYSYLALVLAAILSIYHFSRSRNGRSLMTAISLAVSIGTFFLRSLV